MIRLETVELDLPSGTMLGKYEIVRKLAMGGMAEIYLARSRGVSGFEKHVVLKRILPTVAGDPAFVRMFLEEARLAAALHHPNIGDVYEVEEHEGGPFFAMEFIHGQDVRELKRAARERKERIPVAISLGIVHAIASALDYAHERFGPNGTRLSIVHRDVSPSNVLVSYDGAIKLIDFGIARATSHGRHTQVGTLDGKIAYMSPEQCRGQPLDRRSDLFALGVMMYELTVGRRPFRGENDFAIMDAIIRHHVLRPAEVAHGYPRVLEAIVMKLIAHAPEDRYQSAEALLHELDQFLAEHRLWVSPKTLGRYMRTVFGDPVADIARPRDDEATVARLPTPVARPFPGIARLSQEMPAVHSAAESVPLPADVTVRKRTSRGLVIMLIACGGIAGGLYWMQQAQGHEAAAEAPAQTIHLSAEPIEAKLDDKPAAAALPPDPPAEQEQAPPTLKLVEPVKRAKPIARTKRDPEPPDEPVMPPKPAEPAPKQEPANPPWTPESPFMPQR